uniref:Uncharacterized protein n=1 Tax=Magnetococcus massalia (strain MO-1) TaxID=451514 RepID=A0A1S7LKP3_MAGMO|nr:Protein of unknown function [Candidatus Magnetococcus massalia]
MLCQLSYCPTDKPDDKAKLFNFALFVCGVLLTPFAVTALNKLVRLVTLILVSGVIAAAAFFAGHADKFTHG